MDPLAILLGFAFGLLVGAAVVAFIAARRHARASANLAAANARLEGLTGQLERTDAVVESERERERNDARVIGVLGPVRQQLEAMGRTVTAIEEQRNQQHGELSEQLRLQRETDERLRTTTDGLASALRSNTARGAWGEAQLRNIVTASGMLERVDFETQVQVSTEQGKRRPDMIVHLPGESAIAIDAKAPMSSYLDACDLGDDAESRQRRDTLLTRHAKRLREHVNELADREYSSAFATSPQLVIAFVPSESALSAAVAADPSLIEYAFAKGIAITSPVSLWAVLKSVAASWHHERLTESATEIIELGTQLTNRLGTAAAHIDRLGKSFTTTIGHYNAFVGSLETRVLPTVRRLADHASARSVDQFERVDDHPRGLSAPELTDHLAQGEMIGTADASASAASSSG